VTGVAALREIIYRFDEPVPAEAVAQANRALFAPDPTPDEMANVRICVVLGSANCVYRAERAATAFASRRDVAFVACGAPTTASGLTEARLIAQTLVASGIVKDRILLEELSSNTRENLVEAEHLVTGLNLGESGGIGDGQIAVVSAGFHRHRVVQCLPPVFAGAVFINAFGPRTSPDVWHLSPYGRRVVGDELAALSASASDALR
jgi:hypothetical protein